jgi:hypothetical protein
MWNLNESERNKKMKKPHDEKSNLNELRAMEEAMRKIESTPLAPGVDPRTLLNTNATQSDSGNPFEFEPVSPEEFLSSDGFYGDAEFERRNGRREIWPWIYEEMQEVFSGPHYAPKYTTVVEIAGVGAGKSACVGVVFAYMAYWLHCLRKPASYFNLIEGSTIAFVNLAPSALVARRWSSTKFQRPSPASRFSRKMGGSRTQEHRASWSSTRSR